MWTAGWYPIASASCMARSAALTASRRGRRLDVDGPWSRIRRTSQSTARPQRSTSAIRRWWTLAPTSSLPFRVAQVPKAASSERRPQASQSGSFPMGSLLNLNGRTLEIGERLTPEQIQLLAPMLREAVRDKSYELLPLGEDVAAYLRAKRKRLTAASYRSYEGTLDKLARDFPDLTVEDFEPPTGTARLEQFLDARWGDGAPGTYNVCLAHVTDFFKHFQRIGRLHGNPTLNIERAKKRDIHRSTFTPDQRRSLIASAESLRDRIALRLLFDYGIRKGALAAVEFRHFDHQRKRLTIFTKGQKVRELPLPDPHLWMDLERHIL